MIPLILGNPHIVVSTFFSFLGCWAQGSIKELFGPVPSRLGAIVVCQGVVASRKMRV